jgi:opacity protein-like surface antigen
MATLDVNREYLRRRRCGLAAALGLLALSTSAMAADLAPVLKYNPPPLDAAPQLGFFVGLGAGYNSLKFDRSVYAVGLSDVFDGGAFPVAAGHAEGPATPFQDTRFAFAPEAQIGYFGQLGASNMLWGVKLKYKYADATSSQSPLIVSQAGAFVQLGGGGPTPMYGNVLIEEAQSTIRHELSLLALIGTPVRNGNIYLGVGPALFNTKLDLYQSTGFAQVNGSPNDQTGTPANFESTKWVWGTAAQIGMTYNLAPAWFLDVNYTYAATPRYKTDFVSPFETTSNGLTYRGLAFITVRERLTSQALAVSINRTF